MEMGEAFWLPYCGAAPVPGDWWARWNLDPLLLVALALGAAAFVRWSGAAAARRWWFAAAMALLVLLFVSPFCALTSALFAARVTHHILLTALVAPLLVAAWSARICAGVALWAGLHAVIFWGWHAPRLHHWASVHAWVFLVEQASFLVAGLLLWLAALGEGPRPSRGRAGAGALALLLTATHMTLLGVLLVSAPRLLYAHVGTDPAQALADQQLGGVLMLAVGGVAYLVGALVLLRRLLRQPGEARA